MILSLPVASASEERIFLSEIQMRFVNLFQLFPCRFPLLWRHFRMIVYDMLEFIHHTAIWDKGNGILHLRSLEIICPVSEEQIHPGIGEKFH